MTHIDCLWRITCRFRVGLFHHTIHDFDRAKYSSLNTSLFLIYNGHQSNFNRSGTLHSLTRTSLCYEDLRNTTLVCLYSPPVGSRGSGLCYSCYNGHCTRHCNQSSGQLFKRTASCDTKSCHSRPQIRSNGAEINRTGPIVIERGPLLGPHIPYQMHM